MSSRSSRALLGYVGVALALGAVSGSAAPTPPLTFAAAKDYGTGDRPQAVAVADLNGDSFPDVVTANAFGTSTVSVLLNRGDGTFLPRTDYQTGSTPRSVAVGDLNGDGKPDLVTGNWRASTVSVLLNLGDGTFEAQERYETGLKPRSVAIADLDGHGKPDIVTANARGGTVSVLLNRGDGTFLPKADYPAAETPVSVAAGDLNGDGAPDLVTANSVANTVSVLLNRGYGTFEPQVSYETGDQSHHWKAASSVALGDLNGDAKPDLVVVSYGARVSSLLNRGDGTFRALPAYFDRRIGPLGVAVGDLNGDGARDLAVAGDDAAGAVVAVFMGNGDGSWRTPLTLYHRVVGAGPRGGAHASVALGDLNRDGKLDVATTNNDSSFVSVLVNTPGLCDVQRVAGWDAMRLAAARRTLARANCGVEIVKRVRSSIRRGYVVSQKPKFGSVLPGGGKVDLVVSLGPKR